jgi:hypothetical protein
MDLAKAARRTLGSSYTVSILPDFPHLIIQQGELPVGETGFVIFKASADFDNPKSNLRQLARELARKLGACLQGDEGETYE